MAEPEGGDPGLPEGAPPPARPGPAAANGRARRRPSLPAEEGGPEAAATDRPGDSGPAGSPGARAIPGPRRPGDVRPARSPDARATPSEEPEPGPVIEIEAESAGVPAGAEVEPGEPAGDPALEEAAGGGPPSTSAEEPVEGASGAEPVPVAPAADGRPAGAGEAPADEAGPEPSPEMASLLRLERDVNELARLGQRNADHVAALHGENQRLRAGEVAGSVAPLLRDVIRLHDDVLRLEGVCAPEAALDLGLVRKLVVDALDRWGVQAFEPAVGDPFDASEHNGMARVETPEQLDGTVASVRRCGFRGEQGRVWRPADVDVFRTIDRQPAGPPAGEE